MKSLLLFLVLSFSLASSPALSAGGAPDFAHHPLYAKYRFGGREAKVVDIGTQPMAVPAGVVGAALGHDRLLRAALTSRGWELRNHSFLKGPDSNFFFQRGDLEVAIAGDWPTITLAASHDLQVVGLAKQSFSSIITKGLRRVEDLKGKRIGSAAGTTSHYALLVALDNAGLEESDVTLVPLEVNEMGEALAQGKVEAFASWEPVSTNTLRTHPEFTVVQRFLNNSYIYLSTDLARQTPEIAEQVVASYVRSLRWMREDRKNLMRAIDWTLKAGTQMLGKPPTLSPEDMARTTTDDLLKIAPSPMVPRQDLTEQGSIRRAFTFLQGQGKIDAAIPWTKIEQSFDRTLIDRILADPEGYQLLSFDYDE